MNLKMVRISVSVLMTLMFQSGYGVPSIFAKAVNLAVNGNQKAAVQTIIDNGQGHCLRVIDPAKEPTEAKTEFPIIEPQTNEEERQNEQNETSIVEGIIDIGNAKFYVPNYPIDLIQTHIVNSGTFFESDILEELRPYINNNAVILDLGANIGNHSIYWATRTNAKRIYSFEPVHYTFEILKRNIEINGLADKVKIFNVGLSDQKINGSICYFDESNIGGTNIKQDLNGNLSLDKLDNINIEDNEVDFVKIDVEGHELQALEGARETLIKYTPVIFIETFDNHRQKVHKYLTDLGYQLKKSFPGSNYLYIHNDNE